MNLIRRHEAETPNQSSAGSVWIAQIGTNRALSSVAGSRLRNRTRRRRFLMTAYARLPKNWSGRMIPPHRPIWPPVNMARTITISQAVPNALAKFRYDRVHSERFESIRSSVTDPIREFGNRGGRLPLCRAQHNQLRKIEKADSHPPSLTRTDFGRTSVSESIGLLGCLRGGRGLRTALEFWRRQSFASATHALPEQEFDLGVDTAEFGSGPGFQFLEKPRVDPQQKALSRFHDRPNSSPSVRT